MSKTYNLKTEEDLYPENPRSFDNVSTFFCLHKKYNLGDTPELYEMWDCDFCPDNYNSFQEMIDDNFNHNDVIVPLYLYDHSEITLSTKPFSCKWDSGQVGFAFVTKKKIIKEFGRYNKKTREMAIMAIDAEVEEYNKYLHRA